VASNQHEYPKETLPTAGLSPALPFPPLPPLPPEDPTNGDSSVGPPLPSEDNPSDLDHLSNQPPPPPPEALPSEKSDQINTSTSQVENMRSNLYVRNSLWKNIGEGGLPVRFYVAPSNRFE
jgi:hypothetical protein